MHDILAHPYVAGALSGVLTAALIDYQAFRSWKSFQEAMAYDWGKASFRWLQGAVAGVIAAAGHGAILGA